MQTITVIGGAILLFLCAILGFRWGLRLGMQAAKGQAPPKLNLNPVKAVKETVAKSKQDKEVAGLMDDFSKMMQYDGFTPEERR